MAICKARAYSLHKDCIMFIMGSSTWQAWDRPKDSGPTKVKAMIDATIKRRRRALREQDPSPDLTGRCREGDFGVKRRSFRVAADIGGTFTDLVFQDAESGHCSVAKVLSTPDNLAHAVIEGLVANLPSESNVDFFIHGTTVGLNAVLTRRGAKVALLTTENYRDVYTIQGNDRREIFSIHWRKPKPLLPIPDTFTARERINARGGIEIPLDVRDLDA